MWLDVARYGEHGYRSLGPTRRGYNPYPYAYVYRNWVVRAFNDDMPYGTFVKAQLAGDLMNDGNRVHLLPGTGFLALGPWFYDNGAVEVTCADERNDLVDAVLRGLLGITFACAAATIISTILFPAVTITRSPAFLPAPLITNIRKAPNAAVERIKQFEKELEKQTEAISSRTKAAICIMNCLLTNSDGLLQHDPVAWGC